MGEVIYIPISGVWMDGPRICIKDLFPGKTFAEADAIMVSGAQLIESFLEHHGQRSLGVQWINRVDLDDNPKGEIGFYRFYRKDPGDFS